MGAAAGLPLECARVHDGCRGRTPLSAQVGARPGLLVDRANLHRSRSRRTPADAKVAAGEWVPMGPACTRSRPHAGGGLDSVTSCDGVSDCALDPGTSDCGLAPRPCAAAEVGALGGDTSPACSAGMIVDTPRPDRYCNRRVPCRMRHGQHVPCAPRGAVWSAWQPKGNLKKRFSKAIFVYSRFCLSPTPHRRGAGALSRTYSLTSRPLSGRLSTRQTRKHESGCQQSWRDSHSLTAERSTADAKGRGREVGAGRQLFSSQRRLEVHKIGRRPAASSALPTRSLVGASFPIEASASSSRTPRRGRRLVARRCRAGAGAAGGRARGRQRCRLDGREGGRRAQTTSLRPPRLRGGKGMAHHSAS